MIGGCLRGRLVPSIYTDKCKSGVQTTQLPGNIGQPPAINHRWWNSCVGVQVPQSCDTGATEFGAVAVQCWTFVMIADGHMLMMQRLTTCIFLRVHITWLKRHYRKWRRMEFFGWRFLYCVESAACYIGEKMHSIQTYYAYIHKLMSGFCLWTSLFIYINVQEYI